MMGPGDDDVFDGDDEDFVDEREYDFFDCSDMDDDRSMFADPGGVSALRAATPSNPRNLPCPTCGEPDRLTPADRALHYQCDECAGSIEGSGH